MRETGTNHSPHGLQLQLAVHRRKLVNDMHIMENLHYLQFKATPGVYHLEICKGCGCEAFALESVGNEG